jgi:hypothetical protein
MEHSRSLTFPHEPATGPYHEPVPSTPHLPNLSLHTLILILSSHIRLVEIRDPIIFFKIIVVLILLRDIEDRTSTKQKLNSFNCTVWIEHSIG